MAANAAVSPVRLRQSDHDLERILGHPVSGRRLKIVVVGAHPDDPETGCGGTVASLTHDGHCVLVIYLTRGEAGVRGADHGTTARVRSREAQDAVEILGATAVFANQIDGRTTTTSEDSRCFTDLLGSLRPEIVFTHWPHDTHPDHRNTAELTRSAWEALGRAFTLVYYEVMTGIQTQDFPPNL
jgi:LmbE family N-acetylglucosaminyl deacetylase